MVNINAALQPALLPNGKFTPEMVRLIKELADVASVDSDPLIAQAINEVQSSYGEKVSVARKKKGLTKFGRSELVSTSITTLASFGASAINETYVSSNTITHVSSANSGDTQDLKYEYHTIDGEGNFTFGVGEVTLNGQNKVALPIAAARVSRAYNDDSTDLSGAVYFFEDDTVTSGVPNTASKIHMVIPAGTNQTFKASTTISNSDYWFISKIYVSLLKKTAADVDVFLEVREKGKVFRPIFEVGLTTDGSNAFEATLNPYLIIPKNSDVRMRAVALSGTGISVAGSFSGSLAKII